MDAPRPKAVVLLAHSPYPIVSGNSRRAAALIGVLSERFDVVVLAADADSPTVPHWSSAVRRHLHRRRSRISLALDSGEGIVRGRHVLLVRSIRAGLESAFRGVIERERPAVVLLGRPMFGPFVEIARGTGALVVVDADESMPRVAWAIARSRHSSLRQRGRAAVEAVAVLGRMERSSYPRVGQVWVSSAEERARLSRWVPRERVFVIPNVMDTPDSVPGPFGVRAVAFVGSYAYPPNEAAALELISTIMPVVRSLGGPARLVLIGPGVSQSMERAAAASGNVEMLGTVPEVRSHLQAAGLVVAPLRAGGGTRVKILEAMAAGVPVISTSIGVEGLDLRPGDEVLLAASAAEFADQVIRVQGDERLRVSLTTSAFDRVRRAHSTQVLAGAVWAALGSPNESTVPT